MSNADFLYTLSARLDSEVAFVFAQFEAQGRQAGQRVSQSVATVGQAADQSSEKLKAAAAAARLFEGGIGGVATRLSGLNELLRTAGIFIAGPLALIAGAAAFVNYGSTIQSAQARLRAMTDSTADFNRAQAATIAIARDAHASLTETIQLYSQLTVTASKFKVPPLELNAVVGAVEKTSAIQGLPTSQSQGASLNFREAFDNNFQSAGQQLTRLSKESPLLVQTIIEGLNKLGTVKFDGTLAGLRELSKSGQLNSKLVSDALTVMAGTLTDKLNQGGRTITQAKNDIATAFAEIIIKVESATSILGGTANGISYLSNHLTELGGVLTVVGAAYAASLAAPLLAGIPALLSTSAAVARLVLGFNGLGPALLAGGLGASKLSTALGALLSPTNLLVVGFAAVAGAIYYFATRESEAEKASRDLGIAQDALAAKVLAATGRIIAQNSALGANVNLSSARSRAEAQDKLGSAKGDETSARTNLAARLRLFAVPGADAGNALIGLSKQVDAGLPIQQITAALDQLQAKFPSQFTSLKSFGKDINSVADDLAVATTRVKGIEDQISGAGKAAFTATPASGVAAITIKQMQDAAKVASTSIDTVQGVNDRARQAIDALNVKYKGDTGKGGTFEDPAKAAEYQTEINQIEATRQQGIEAVHATAAAKRDAAKEDREAKAAQAKTDRENERLIADAGRSTSLIDKQNNEAKITALETFKKIADATNDQPRANDNILKLQNENVAALLAGAQSFGQYIQQDAALAAELVKPLREAAAQSALLAATDNLELAGNADAAEVLRRAVDLRSRGLALSQINLDTINKTVIAEGERSTALAHQNDLINVYARSAGAIQSSFRDLFAGGTIGDFGKSLISNLKNSLADELSIKIFGNAEQDARDQMTGALGANTDALATVRQALQDYASALKNPVALGDAVGAGISDSIANAASSPLKGAANDNGSSLANVDNPNVQAAQAGRVLGGAGGLLGGVFALFASSNNKLTSSISGVSTALTGGGTAGANANLPRGAGANFSANLSKQLGQLGDFLDKKIGSGTATGGTQDAGSGALGKAGSAVGKFAGEALAGYQQGAEVTGILQSLGIGKNNTGSKVGGGVGAVAGEAIGGPAGAAIGQVLGSLIGSAFGGVTARAFTQLSINNGVAVTGASRARGDKEAENLGTAGQLATTFSSALNSLASAFGGKLQNGANLGEIGVYNGKFGFHRQFGDGGGDVQTATDAAGAVALAIKNAINTGAVEGLREGTKRLLTAAGDFTAQTSKAQKYEQVFTDLKAAVDPVGAAIDTVNKKFGDLQSIFSEAGASASDYASLQQLYDLQRADALKTAEANAVSTLQDYLTSLTTNASTGLSARDRQAAAQATFDPLATQVQAGKTVDQNAFKTAADALLGVDRELFGSTNEYFTRLSDITSLTQKAISNASTAATDPNAATLVLTPSQQAAPITDSIASLQSALLAQGADQSALLARLVASAANANGATGGVASVLSGGKAMNF